LGSPITSQPLMQRVGQVGRYTQTTRLIAGLQHPPALVRSGRRAAAAQQPHPPAWPAETRRGQGSGGQRRYAPARCSRTPLLILRPPLRSRPHTSAGAREPRRPSLRPQAKAGARRRGSSCRSRPQHREAGDSARSPPSRAASRHPTRSRHRLPGRDASPRGPIPARTGRGRPGTTEPAP
jgi:hypothetical protein